MLVSGRVVFFFVMSLIVSRFGNTTEVTVRKKKSLDPMDDLRISRSILFSFKVEAS